jgi:cell wall-associated NlpC family hydrolase
MNHWATPLIGKPWQRGALGPDAFDCWGLVRHVFAARWGIEMPAVAVGGLYIDAPANVAAIKRAASISGWAPVKDSQPADGDIVLMHSPSGRHVGVMIEVDGSLRLLHSFEGAGACAQPLADVGMAGFWGFEYWRHAA